MGSQPNETANQRMEKLEREYKKWKHSVRWMGSVIICAFLIVAALNAHYIRAAESTFSRLQDAINTVSASVGTKTSSDEATGETPDSQIITVEVDHANLLSADYLAGIIPVIIGLAGALVVFLGMERLKAFDERIDSANSDTREKLDEFRKEASENHEKLQKDIEGKLGQFDIRIEQRHSQFREDQFKEIERSVREQFGEEQKKWDEREKQVTKAQTDSKVELDEHKKTLLKDLDEDALKHLADLDAKALEYMNGLESYSWLRAIIQEGETEISVPTVEDAHRLIERLRAEKHANYINMIRRIVDKICNEKLSGDNKDYHNCAAELARGSMYIDACRVLECGLQYFPKDVDLLADLVEYTTKGGLIDKAEEVVKRLENEADIPKNQWNWRCYEFTCDYYKARGDYQAAYDLSDAFIKAIPDDERGYRIKSECERQLHPGKEGIERSIAALRQALDQNITCPQCANSLSEMLLDNGRIEEALAAINRAIRDLAQQQPHISSAIAFFNRANIWDRMCLQNKENTEEQQTMAENASRDYRMSLYLGLPPTISKQAVERIRILSSYYSTSVDPNPDFDLMQFLKSFKPESEDVNNT